MSHIAYLSILYVMNIDNVDEVPVDQRLIPINCNVPSTDRTEILNNWILIRPALAQLANTTTYDGIRLCGEQISFLGFNDTMLPSLRDPLEFEALSAFPIATTMVRMMTRAFDTFGLERVTTFIFRVVKWATDVRFSEIEAFALRQENHINLRPLAILAALGFDGAVLRLLGLMNRVIRPYHPPWWHAHINVPTTRNHAGNYFDGIFPDAFVATLIDMYGLPTGPLAPFNYERWVQSYRPFLRATNIPIHILTVRTGQCNVLIFSNGLCFVPAHLFNARQAYSFRCRCGNNHRGVNRARTPCCGETIIDHHTSILDAEIEIVGSIHQCTVDSVRTVICVIATMGDLAMCAVRGQSQEELSIRSAVTFEQIGIVNPAGFDDIVTIVSNAGEFDVPVWGYPNVTGFLRTISGAMGLCGTVLAVMRRDPNNIHNVNLSIIAVDVSAHNMDNVSEFRVFPGSLLDLVRDGNLVTAVNQRLS